MFALYYKGKTEGGILATLDTWEQGNSALCSIAKMVGSEVFEDVVEAPDGDFILVNLSEMAHNPDDVCLVDLLEDVGIMVEPEELEPEGELE